MLKNVFLGVGVRRQVVNGSSLFGIIPTKSLFKGPFYTYCVIFAVRGKGPQEEVPIFFKKKNWNSVTNVEIWLKNKLFALARVEWEMSVWKGSYLILESFWVDTCSLILCRNISELHMFCKHLLWRHFWQQKDTWEKSWQVH